MGGIGNMTKIIKIMIVITLISTFVVGCDNTPSNDNTKQNNDNSGVINKKTDENNKKTNPPKTDIDQNLYHVTGEYIGQIDNHSVEIQFNNKSYTLEIGEVLDVFNYIQLNEGDTVDIAYQENEHGQYIIKDIKKIEDTSSDEVEGIYIGQIDPQSIEIKVNGVSKVFQILKVEEQFKELNLHEGEIILFSYTKDKNQVLIIKSIKNK